MQIETLNTFQVEQNIREITLNRSSIWQPTLVDRNTLYIVAPTHDNKLRVIRFDIAYSDDNVDIENSLVTLANDRDYTTNEVTTYIGPIACPLPKVVSSFTTALMYNDISFDITRFSYIDGARHFMDFLINIAEQYDPATAEKLKARRTEIVRD